MSRKSKPPPRSGRKPRSSEGQRDLRYSRQTESVDVPSPAGRRERTLRGAAETLCSAADGLGIAYDQDLLDRARAHWRLGEWENLRALTPADIQHHPARARLALLAAAGHLAAAERMSARLFAGMAIDWGCDRQLVARVLAGGVHNTLARAAVAGGRYHNSALRHFEQALASGGYRMVSDRALHARMEHEVNVIGLANQLPELCAGRSVAARPASSGNPWQQLRDEFKARGQMLEDWLKSQRDQSTAQQEKLEASIKREVVNATKQLESFLNVQAALNGSDLMPKLHGWPISPDLAELMVNMIRTTAYDLVIEFGSGSSTVIIAKALALKSKDMKAEAVTQQIAFEHLDEYRQQTMANLQLAGLAEAAVVHLAPLKPWRSAAGKVYPYYDCHDALAGIQPILDDVDRRVLVLVDGPPASTGEHARYPALPVLLDAKPQAGLDIVLDDFDRPDEREIVSRWEEDLAAAGRRMVKEVPKLEKGGIIIRIAAARAE